MVQSHILEHGNLQYDNFMQSFLKLIVCISGLLTLADISCRIHVSNWILYHFCSVRILANMFPISLSRLCHIWKANGPRYVAMLPASLDCCTICIRAQVSNSIQLNTWAIRFQCYCTMMWLPFEWRPQMHLGLCLEKSYKYCYFYLCELCWCIYSEFIIIPYYIYRFAQFQVYIFQNKIRIELWIGVFYFNFFRRESCFFFFQWKSLFASCYGKKSVIKTQQSVFI